MSRITALMTSRNILSDITAANERLRKTQEQLSSGKVLNKPSDDPAEVARAMQLRSDLEGAKQYQENASEASGWTDVTDAALRSVADVLMRVRELTVQGANGAAGPESHQAIAKEIEQLVDSLKTAGNASYGGRYVFSGTRTDTPPYAMGADDTYYGNGEHVHRQIGAGVTVPVSVAGNAAIGTGATGLLGTIRTVQAAAIAGDHAALSTQLGALDTRLDELNAVRAQVGATGNRVSIAASRLAEYEGTAMQLLNDTESVDLAKAMIDFSTQQAALQAGLKAGAQIVQASLLDFLR
jgi:flagellar hook-associated protein 3 FlgL